MNPKVSVIIPTYNRSEFIKKSVDSVIEQTFKDFELIIIDDGSKDKTSEIISGYKNKVIYFYQENKGPAAARNKGIALSKGLYIAFLDSDDTWDKNKLQIQIRQMENNPEFPISHTQEIWYRNGKILNQKNIHKKYNGYIFERCLPLCAVGMSTIVAKKEIFEKVGFFDESLPCCEDYDLWLRASIKYPFLLIDKPLTQKDGGRKDQVSKIFAVGMDKFRIKSITKILKDTNLTPSQREAAIKTLIHKCNVYGKGCIKHNKPDEGRYYLKLPLNFELPAGV